MVIIMDRDANDIKYIENELKKDFHGEFTNIKNQEWVNHQFVNSSEQEIMIEMLLLVIPEECQGALETVLLQAISENPYDEIIVDECGEFVRNIRPQAAKYIKSDRLELKAWLNTTWAIQSPEKAFDFINELIMAVPWEKSEILKKCFAELRHI